MTLLIYNKREEYFMMVDYQDIDLILELLQDNNFMVLNSNLFAKLMLSLAEDLKISKTVRIPK